ncbi:hypothetical protein AQUCO_12300015v1 [Aquilegia coerulea]|uniref:Uncharacterized protein n=1 Tax=Aquilegia coerulea TaxID=218851 RepID=A0A2G5C1K7_AQUCA|nr:hypothetical protein AQUCO_12300015v1 [Aquilegia coerulea]
MWLLLTGKPFVDVQSTFLRIFFFWRNKLCVPTQELKRLRSTHQGAPLAQFIYHTNHTEATISMESVNCLCLSETQK